MTKSARATDVPLPANSSKIERGSSTLAARLRSAVRIARTTGPMLRRRSAAAVAASRTGLGWTTRTVREMPSSTTRSLTAGSIGLGAGLYLGGAPRLVAATGLAPAVVIGAAMLLQPEDPVVAPESAR